MGKNYIHHLLSSHSASPGKRKEGFQKSQVPNKEDIIEAIVFSVSFNFLHSSLIGEDYKGAVSFSQVYGGKYK